MRLLWIAAVLLVAATPAAAQGIPTALTDRIQQGEGVINLLRDVSGDDLTQYLNSTNVLRLGIDVNESSDGLESSTSQGIAIRSLSLIIRTTAGDFTFSDFYTSTSAMLRASGSSVAQEYYTVFGSSGSNDLNIGADRFDDVIYLNLGAISGTILSASLEVSFLAVDGRSSRSTAAESFFDFSGGFEELAILSAEQATALEAARVGESAAPASVVYTSAEVSPDPVPPSSGAPALPAWMGLGLLVLALLHTRRS